MSNNKLGDHINDGEVDHLRDSSIIDNEFDVFSINVDKIPNENISNGLDEIHVLKGEIQHLRKNEVIIMDEIYKLKTTDKSTKNEIVKCKANYLEIQTKIETILNHVKKDNELYEKAKLQINNLSDTVKKVQSSEENVNTQLKQISLEIETCKKSFENVNSKEINFGTDLLNFSNQLFTMSKSFEEFKVDTEEMKNELLRSNEYIWKIDSFSLKIKNAETGENICVSSESFLSHKYGYSLRLHIYPKLSFSSHVGKDLKINNYVGIHFSVLKGEHDAILQWPLTKVITIAIINQKTKLEPHKQNFSVANVESSGISCFDRPLKKENPMCGNQAFIELDKLLSSDSLIKNDTIFISCSVS